MVNVDSLRTDGKVYIPYPSALRAAMREAMLSWQRFCNLPEEVKIRFEYSPDQAQSGNGYELKLDSGEKLDRKENFHFRLSALDELRVVAKQVEAQEALDLIESLEVLPELIKVPLLDFAEAVESTFRVPGFKDDVQASIPELIIRLLHYFGEVQLHEVIAQPHIDKGGFTLHLWESDGGVEQLSLDKKEWIPIPVSHDEALIFPASGLQHLLKSEVKALCHRVVSTITSAHAGRYSAVCFVDFRGNAHYDKRRHGRLQNREAGFNYDMSWDAFDDLFVR
jgi:hypothetical protein